MRERVVGRRPLRFRLGRQGASAIGALIVFAGLGAMSGVADSTVARAVAQQAPVQKRNEGSTTSPDSAPGESAPEAKGTAQGENSGDSIQPTKTIPAEDPGEASDRNQRQSGHTVPSKLWIVIIVLGLLISIGLLLLLYFLKGRGLIAKQKKAMKILHGNLGTFRQEMNAYIGSQTKFSESLRLEMRRLSDCVSALEDRLGALEEIAAKSGEAPGIGDPSPAWLPQEGSSESSASGLSFPFGGPHHELAIPALPPRVRLIDDGIKALNRGDRIKVRDLAEAELNITEESEEALSRGQGSQPTRLRTVTGGGSYLLVREEDQAWLLPTVQILASYRDHRPSKGIFAFESQASATVELIQAARVRDLGGGGFWEVVEFGRVAVPS